MVSCAWLCGRTPPTKLQASKPPVGKNKRGEKTRQELCLLPASTTLRASQVKLDFKPGALLHIPLAWSWRYFDERCAVRWSQSQLCEDGDSSHTSDNPQGFVVGIDAYLGEVNGHPSPNRRGLAPPRQPNSQRSWPLDNRVRPRLGYVQSDFVWSNSYDRWETKGGNPISYQSQIICGTSLQASVRTPWRFRTVYDYRPCEHVHPFPFHIYTITYTTWDEEMRPDIYANVNPTHKSLLTQENLLMSLCLGRLSRAFV